MQTVEESWHLKSATSGAPDRRVHFVGICGKGMGAIASALAAEGWAVTGSDADCYPPMSDFLATAGLLVSTPFAPTNLPQESDCVVVVGKRVREDNVELRALLERGFQPQSFPEFLRDAFLHRSRNAVVAGGIGKTSTTAMLTWILECAGLGPDYLIGDLPRNFAMPARFRGAAIAVMEGDEYASSYSDPRPKFLHYAPEVAIVTNLFNDHPDLFEGADSVRQPFEQLARSIPSHGKLILPADEGEIGSIRDAAQCGTSTVGFSAGASRRIDDWDPKPGRIRFSIDGVPFELALFGRMNALNGSMAAVAAEAFGVSLARSAKALATFAGVRNRQDEAEVGDCIVVADKATHPVSIVNLIGGLRDRYPDRRIVVAIQPRATGGRNWVYQRDLPDALALADEVIVTDAYEHNPGKDRQWAGGAFCTTQLATDIAARSTPVRVVKRPEALGVSLRRFIQPGDVIALLLPEQATELRLSLEAALALRVAPVSELRSSA